MAQQPAPAASASAPTGDQYQAVGTAPELTSGETLLVEAYAAFWIALLVFVGVLYLRTRKMEGQIAALVTALARARERDDASRAAGRKATGQRGPGTQSTEG